MNPFPLSRVGSKDLSVFKGKPGETHQNILHIVKYKIKPKPDAVFPFAEIMDPTGFPQTSQAIQDVLCE